MDSPVRPLETRFNRIGSLGIGLLLPVLTLRTEYYGTPTDLASRVVPVDFVCIAFVLGLFFFHRMEAIPLPSLCYLAAIVVSLVPGLAVSPGPEREVWVQFTALLMAFGFYVVGLNVGASGTLLRWLLAGVCISVFAEGIVVLHDLVFQNQWFPDPMGGRVRGTFRANGQLGAFGFCAAGLLVTFGATLSAPGTRKIFVAAAIISASFVFPASRRTGMIAVFAWGALFAILGARFAKERFYALFLGAFLAILILVGVFWTQIESSFVGRRFLQAFSTLGVQDGFIQNQFKDCCRTAEDWFPFGFGAGRGSRIDPRAGYEVHNGVLAVLVELGVLGLLGYLGMVVQPLLGKMGRQGRPCSPEHARLGVLVTCFLLISFVFMLHNTLYRDRTFLLYLGIAANLIGRESPRQGPVGAGPRVRQEKSPSPVLKEFARE